MVDGAPGGFASDSMFVFALNFMRAIRKPVCVHVIRDSINESNSLEEG